MITRVGDRAQSERLSGELTQVQDRMRAAQNSIATGKTATNYADMPRDAGVALRTRDLRDRTDVFIKENEKAIDQMRAADVAIGNVVTLTERFRTLMVQRLNDPSGNSLPLDVESTSMTESLAAQLNTRFDGRYLFAGSRNDTPAVELPATTITTTDATLYYLGDEVTTSTRADSDLVIAWGVRASDDAFAGLFAALGKAGQAHVSNDRDTLKVALDQAVTALEQITELRSRLAANTARLEDVTDSQRTSSVYLGEVVARLEDTDIAQAMTQVAQDQTALEASYSLIGRLSSLSLADYLR